MNFFLQLHKIARLEESMDKLAGEGAGAASVALLKEALWAQMKAAAASEPEGVAVGLAKLATRIGYDAETTSGPIAKVAGVPERLDRDLLAVSFASALVVDRTLDKQAAAGEIRAAEAREMQRLNAESAIDDLIELAKTAAPAWLTHPATIGAGIGAATGAGLGAWGDNEDRMRGALMGGLGGAAVGGLGGLAVSHWQQAAAAEQAAQQAAAQATAQKATEEAAAHALQEHRLDQLFDQLLLATGGHPELEQRLIRDRAQVLQHLQAGLPGLPAEIAHDFPNYGQFVPQNLQQLFPNMQGGGKGMAAQFKAKRP